MTKHFEAQATQICANYIQHLLADYATDPTNKWQSKVSGTPQLTNSTPTTPTHQVSPSCAYFHVLSRTLSRN